jgi:hypothetical protein
VDKGLANLPYLQKIGRQINRRLLEVERFSQNSGLSGDSIQRMVQLTVTEGGKKAPSLKFGQPRVMAANGADAIPTSNRRLSQSRSTQHGRRSAQCHHGAVHSQPDDLRSAPLTAEGVDLSAAAD